MSPKTTLRALRPAHLALALLAALLLVSLPMPPEHAAALSPPADQETEPMTAPPSWKEVERLVSEQKYEAAAAVAAELEHQAREAGDDAEWARALIKRVQLRMGLHGYETAVRFLAETPWPEAPRPRAVVGLYYAEALTTYLQMYSWEIRQREKVETTGTVDLEAWTTEQIFTEARRAFQEVWNQRGVWGTESLGDLAEFFEQNNYPARIRGTLRDTVSYLYADLLSNSSLWTPAQSNAVWRLDLEGLLEGSLEGVDPAAAETHPLAAVAAVLRDLEAWHRGGEEGGGGRPEAAFEARRDLLGRLRGSFSQSEDGQRLLADLERHLESLGRRFPWWSMGTATRAEWVRDESTPWALARAREIALEGAAAHPDSLGGKACRSFAEAVEAPDYQLTAMTADGRGRRSIQVQHKNLEALHFRAYPLDLTAEVERSRDWNLLPDIRRVQEVLASAEPAVEWSETLPPTPDYQLHRTFVTPPLVRSGLYLVVASARRDFSDTLNRKSAVRLLVTDLVLVTRPGEAPETLEVTARSGATGEALPGTEVTLYRADYRKGHTRLATYTSGADGTVEIPIPDRYRQNHFLLARRGPHPAVDELNRWWPTPDEDEEVTAALIYTDRSVYRPLQEVLWKVVAYRGRGQEGRFQTLPGTSLTVELIDPNGEPAVSAEVTTNDFGTASGTFTIPPGRLLGGWQLRTSLGGRTAVEVEEYKRPTFEVTLTDPEEALRLNRPAELSGEARYYFGLPVTGGEVDWRVVREPVYTPWWWLRFGSLATYGVGPTETVAAGSAEVEPDGTFHLTFTPEVDERLAAAGMTWSFRVSADLTDEGGETRSASRVFRLGAVAVEASLEPAAGFFEAGGRDDAKRTVRVRRTDLDGVGRAGTGSWRLLALEGPETARLPAEQPLPEPPTAAAEEDGGKEPYSTPGDRLRPRWDTGGYDPQAVLARWSDGREIASGTLEHDAQGRSEITLPALPAGAYRLHYTTEDAYGATYTTFHDLMVAGKGGSRKRAAPLPLPLVLAVEEPSVSVGGTARLLVGSGLAGQPMVLELYRGGRRIETRRLVSGGGTEVIEIPVEPRHRGGFGVRLTALGDHQLMVLHATVQVPWDDRRLTVELASFRDRLTPGGKETWRVEVKGPEGEALEAGAAELLAYMYDRSLDLFAPHHPPDILSLYPSSTWVPDLAATLGSLSEIWILEQGFSGSYRPPSLVPDRLQVPGGYGIGGPGRRGGLVALGAATPMAMRSAKGMPPPAPQPEAAPAEAEASFDRPEGEFVTEELVVTAERADLEEEPVTPRSDFSETAFWEPHLLLGEGGSVAFEFTVPDSVTEWNVWVHALTRDLRGGSLSEKARSVKDLLVRPYLPRFLREGDRAVLQVTVNNAGEVPLSGTLDFEILDPATEASLLTEFGLAPARAEGVPFSVEPGGGTTLSFPVTTPPRVGPVAFRVTARAGGLSDGELRPLPVLPGRFHLAQSRFAALHDRDRRTLSFPELAAGGDPSRIDEQLVVTLDAQLFYSVLDALPYLIDYPYECTEQTLNRFLSTGIVESVFDRYPAVARMAKELASRETRFESWAGDDPNRGMALEETPWLVEARGGKETPEQLIKVLDPDIAAAQRASALAKLRDAQTSLGGFPWWSGGPPSPYMTLYLVDGFARALEFGVEVPQNMVVRAWGYLHRHWLDEWARHLTGEECCWESITYLNYILSSYPGDGAEAWTGGVFTDDDRQRMLEFSFRHWRQHSPRLKAYLALTLKRAGRSADARLVIDSLLDSAKTDPDLGTFWAPEDRAWLWYNDTVESHAFILRALTELDPDDSHLAGLVQWLMLDKKLNHWKSTRATAEAIYALVHYLDQEGALGVTEEATVTAGPIRRTFTFEPESYTGKKTQLVIPGGEIVPTMGTVVVEKDTPGLLFASATWHFSTEKLPEAAEGDFFTVERRFFQRVSTPDGWVLRPLADGVELSPGDQVEVQLTLTAKHQAEYVHLRDPRGAGFEPETLTSQHKWDLGIVWYEEVRDSGTNFFFEWLPVGEYVFKYRLRVAHAGTFKVAPATVQPMYAPEFTAYSAGAVVEVGE